MLLVEGKLVKLLDTQFRQPVGAGFGIHQAEGGGVGREELARVGFKGDDAQRTLRAGKVDDGLMAKMDAVEIPHRHGSAARCGLQPLPMPVNLHLTPVGARCP